MVVVAANSLMSTPCGQSMTFDLTPSGKGGGGKGSGASKQHISKSLWTCCVEAVCDYCRIVFDLFPNQYQVCVAGVDEAKCQPINSWRDEDQEMGKVSRPWAFHVYTIGCLTSKKNVQLPVLLSTDNRLTLTKEAADIFYIHVCLSPISRCSLAFKSLVRLTFKRCSNLRG